MSEKTPEAREIAIRELHLLREQLENERDSLVAKEKACDLMISELSSQNRELRK